MRSGLRDVELILTGVGWQEAGEDGEQAAVNQPPAAAAGRSKGGYVARPFLILLSPLPPIPAQAPDTLGIGPPPPYPSSMCSTHLTESMRMVADLRTP